MKSTHSTVYKNKEQLIEALLHKEDVVLDVGFWGQGTTHTSDDWPHKLLLNAVDDVYGFDLSYDKKIIDDLGLRSDRYFEASAEDFSIDRMFDVVFAGDLIEHLSNQGLFLDQVSKHINTGGRLILTTPNCFSLFNIAGKFANAEPVVNSDHTCYYNKKTLTCLLEKNGWEVQSMDYLYTLGCLHKESMKKKILNSIYAFLSVFTPKYSETLVCVAVKKGRNAQ